MTRNFSRTAALFTAVLLVFFHSSCSFAREIAERRGEGKVQAVKYDDGAWELLVEGKPYFIKGMMFSPVLIGESPQDATMRDWMIIDDNGNGKSDIALDTWADENRNNRRDATEEPEGDFSLLKKMGCNTIRLYHVPSDNALLGDIYKNNDSIRLQYDHLVNKGLLRKLHKEYGIRVIMGNFLGSWTIGSGAAWEEGTDYKNPEHRENIKKSVRAMVLDNKDEPYVLFWLLGNENDIATWSKCNAKTEPEAYATLVGEIAKMIHELDPDHPVAVCNGDPSSANYVKNYAKHAPDVDILAFNSYRGPHGFDFLWKQAKRELDRPVFISEFGIFSYNTIRQEDEEQQLKYLKGCWKDIVTQSASYPADPNKKKTGNSIGCVVFDWADRWYMDGTPSEHSEGTKYWETSPDRLDHEEWFGVVSLGDGSDPLMRQKRKSYEYLADVWNRGELAF